MTLEQIGAALEASGHKIHTGILPPPDPKTREEFEEFSRRHKEFLRKSKESLKKPLWNSTGYCPKCKSRKYFPLFGGMCLKKCANPECGGCYDGMTEEEWFKQKFRRID